MGTNTPVHHADPVGIRRSGCIDRRRGKRAARRDRGSGRHGPGPARCHVRAGEQGRRRTSEGRVSRRKPRAADPVRSKKPFRPHRGCRDIGNYPTVDAVKLLMRSDSRMTAPEIRSAAYDTLLDFKDNAEIAHYLLATVPRSAARRHERSALPVLAVLMASTLPDIAARLPPYLDQQAATARRPGDDRDPGRRAGRS